MRAMGPRSHRVYIGEGNIERARGANVEYDIDRGDIIRRVSLDWDAFVDSNDGADRLHGSRIVGHSLYEFIVGDSTRLMYDQLLHRVRALRSPVVRRFRCDGPLIRRDFAMTLFPTDSGAVTFKTKLVDSVARIRAVRLSFRPDAAYSRCSVCGRVALGDDDYEEPAEALDRLGLVGVTVAYDVCSRCERHMSA